MQAAIDRDTKTYVMMADFTSNRQTNARAKSSEICRTEALTSRCWPLMESSCQVTPRSVVVQLQRSTASSSSRVR